MQVHSTLFQGLRVAALASAAALSFAALAGGNKAKMMDVDGDGKVSASEHAAGAQSKFAKLDANSDGSVTAAEMDAGHKGMMKEGGMKEGDMTSAEKIAAIDSNADGQLSAAEHTAGSASMFTKMDADGDGFVTDAEMRAGHDKMMKQDKMTTKDDTSR